MRAFRDQEIVGRPQHRAKREGIGLPPIVAAASAMIAHGLARAGHRAFEQSARIGAGEGAERGSRKVKRFGSLRPGRFVSPKAELPPYSSGAVSAARRHSYAPLNLTYADKAIA